MSNTGMWKAPLRSKEKERGNAHGLTPSGTAVDDPFLDRAVGSGDGLFHNPALLLTTWVGQASHLEIFCFSFHICQVSAKFKNWPLCY